MKYNNKHVLMALVAATLLASGCTDTGGGEDPEAGTNPIQATDFSASPNPAPNGNTVTFTLELINYGNRDAENVVGKLKGPTFADQSSDTRTWRDSEGGEASNSDRTFEFGTLRGQEEGVDTYGQPDTVTLKAPNLEERQEDYNYDMKAEYAYKYQTSGDATVTVMDSETFRENGGERSSDVKISHNSAPISLTGQLQQGNPIVFYEGDGATKEPQFCVIARNVGGGTVFSNPEQAYQNGRYIVESQGTDREDKLTLSIESVGSTGVKKADSEGSYSDTASATVELIQGNERQQCFQLEINSLADSGSQKEIGPISVDATYGYKESTGTIVTVDPR